MKPYSKDLRLRVLAAVDSGVPREEKSPKPSRFRCRPSNAGSSGVAKPGRRRAKDDPPGRPRLKGAALEEWLPSRLQNNNDLTLEEHREEAFEEHKAWWSRRPRWGGPSPVCPEEAGRSKKVEGSSRARRGGKGPVAVAGASHFDARRLAFIDESGINISMTRLRARAPRERSEGLRQGSEEQLPQEHHTHRFDHPRRRLGESVAIEGATDAEEVFEAYVESISWRRP